MKFTLSLAAMVLATFATLAHAADGLIEVKSPHSAKDTMNQPEDIVKQPGLNVFTRIDHSAGACPVVENLRKALAGIAEAAVAK